MNETVNNVGELYNDSSMNNILQTASTSFELANSNAISMIKTINKPGELYFPNELIVFTITIINNSNSNISGLFFRDVIDDVVNPISGINYLVTTTSGIITNSSNPVSISGININANETVTITISGRIANR